jgi:sterol desaturase/sphingolipid hydroxylase (fatty acid hydroxylase superfamily)
VPATRWPQKFARSDGGVPPGVAAPALPLDTNAQRVFHESAVNFQPQATREPSIRLFRSDLLESLTHIHPAVVVVVWTPVIGWFAWDAWSTRALTGITGGEVLWAAALGIVAWTLVEYLLHRFVFHLSPTNPGPRLQRLIYLFHGIHHVQPWDRTRLVMPPPVSVPLAVLFYWLFAWVVGDVAGRPSWLSPMFATFLGGYLIYDLVHYATHHLPMRGPVGRWLKRHHLLHHHVTPHERFGVSSPLWDAVFRTLPESASDADVDTDRHVHAG